jgi:hypothetical protein
MHGFFAMSVFCQRLISTRPDRRLLEFRNPVKHGVHFVPLRLNVLVMQTFYATVRIAANACEGFEPLVALGEDRIVFVAEIEKRGRYPFRVRRFPPTSKAIRGRPQQPPRSQSPARDHRRLVLPATELRVGGRVQPTTSAFCSAACPLTVVRPKFSLRCRLYPRRKLEGAPTVETDPEPPLLFVFFNTENFAVRR